MEFLHQSYRTKYFRPAPEITLNSAEMIFIASTPWGSRESALKINNDILDYLSSVKNDVELTSPFPVITSLSPLANSVRTALMLSNEFLFRHNNKDSFLDGLETLVVIKKQDELCIGSYGQPLILAKYINNIDYYPILFQRDLDPQNEPLPEDLLGADSACHPNLVSLKFSQIEELILIAHSRPSLNTLAAFGISRTESDKIEKWTHAIAQTMPQIPFWIGQLKLNVTG